MKCFIAYAAGINFSPRYQQESTKRVAICQFCCQLLCLCDHWLITTNGFSLNCRMVKKSVLRDSLSLSLFWTGILLLPIGRSWWLDTLHLEYKFYLICWLLGILLFPIQLHFYSKRKFHQPGMWWLFSAQLLIGIALGSAYQFYINQNIVTKSIRFNSADWQGIEPGSTTLHFVSGDAYSVFYLYALHTAISLIWLYNGALKKKQLNEEQLKAKLATSQIKVLQSELQPHFIFNTLHTASSLMEEDVEKAQLLLEKFAFLLRHYLSIVSHQFYTLEEEIDFLKKYIDVQQIRSSARIEMQVDMKSFGDHVLVPVIFLQPIIENAIKHGWHDRHQDFVITIQIQVNNGYCDFSILDSGTPGEQIISEGIGLRNLRDRLRVLYEVILHLIIDLSMDVF